LFGESSVVHEGGHFDIRVIGPHSSSVLETTFKSLNNGGRAIFGEWHLPPLRFYSSSATAFREGTRNLPTIRAPEPVARLTTTDDRHAEVLVDELRLRLSTPNPLDALKARNEKPDPLRDATVALISEADSEYARKFKEHVRKRWCEQQSSAQSTANECNIKDFVYLRGLDGLGPRSSAKEPSASKDSGEPRANDLGQYLQRSALERADGNNQYDYLRRLSGQLLDYDRSEKRDGKRGIAAIGILGNDPYDKLLVIDALRDAFPQAVFFTSDLDARFLDKEALATTRNLVVVSPYGLTLHEIVQKNVPPFRDTYQTGVFLSTVVALHPQYRDKPQSFFDCWFSQPHLYEIGRTTQIRLPHEEKEKRDCKESSLTDTSWKLGKARQVHPSPAGSAFQPWPNRHTTVAGGLLTLAILSVSLFLLGTLRFASDHGERTNHLLCTDRGFLALCGLGITVMATLLCCTIALAGRAWRLELTLIIVVLCLIALAARRGLTFDSTALRQLSSGWQQTSAPWRGMATLVLAAPVAWTVWLVHRIAENSTSSGGEPFVWLEGVSVWPTQLIRSFTLVVISVMFVWGRLALMAVVSRIETEYALTRSVSPTAKEQSAVGAAWDRFRDDLSMRNSTFRVIARTALLFALCVALMSLQWPHSPHRGALAAWINHGLLLAVTLAIVALLVVAMDVSSNTGKLLLELGRRAHDIPSDWRDSDATRRMERAYGRRARCLATTFFFALDIATSTNRFVYLPFIALALLLPARSRLFDAWDFPVPYLILLAVMFAIAVFCTVHLRRRAYRLRDEIVEALDVMARQAKSNDLPAACEADRAGLEKARDDIRSCNRGVLRPIVELPVVRAILIVLGAGGAIVTGEFFWLSGR
jgi:hypothetical protein